MSRAYDTAEHRRNGRKAKVRDNWTCRRCGRHASQLPRGRWDITAAHIVPAERGGTNAVSNYVTLCRYCHGAVDGGRRYTAL